MLCYVIVCYAIAYDVMLCYVMLCYDMIVVVLALVDVAVVVVVVVGCFICFAVLFHLHLFAGTLGPLFVYRCCTPNLEGLPILLDLVPG